MKRLSSTLDDGVNALDPLPPKDAQEESRQRRLDMLDLDAAEAETVLELMVQHAAWATGRPMAMLSLVDEQLQWSKAAVGLPAHYHAPRHQSICAHVIAEGGFFEVEDLRRDDRFADNPQVTGEPHLVHYAAYPLEMPGGERIGTFCVLDHKPGLLDERARDELQRLARTAVQVLLLREHEHDLAREVRATAAVRDSEARFRRIADRAPHMVWGADGDGRVLFFNARWYEFMGVAPGTEVGVEWHALVHPDDLERICARWRESVNTGRAFEAECRLFNHQGEYRWLLVRATVAWDENDGGELRWLGTCTDIDDQKRAEAALREADRHKDEFLAMLVHELRNPLAPIASAVDIVNRLDNKDPKLTWALGVIERQIGQATRLLADLMDISRIKQRKLDLQKSRITLNSALEQAIEASRPVLEQHGHQFDAAIPAEPIYLDADHGRLVQVFSNLLNNAAKYTDRGGKVTLSVHAHIDHVDVSVKDSGVGISGDMLTRIFGAFTQAEPRTRYAQGGLGIGLALVKSFVQLHGGEIEARSAGPGRGSEFVVRLPMSARRAAGALPANAG